MDLQFWTQPVSRRVTLLATLASAGVHAFVVTVLLPAGLQTVRDEPDQRLLPALYLYALDHQPRTPREVRLPTAHPLGTLKSDEPETTPGDGEGIGLPSRPVLEGMLPTGVPEVTLDSVFSVLDVDSEVVRYASSAGPNYPPSLLEAGIEGVVESEFVVDTTGWVDLTSVKIMFATDPEFSRSVQQALNQMQFRPALRGTHKVRQLVHQRFTFHIQGPPPTGDAAS